MGPWGRYVQESVTSTWIRATSPKCNCSTSYTVPKNADAATTSELRVSRYDIVYKPSL
jgi:hypothetical protein